MEDFFDRIIQIIDNEDINVTSLESKIGASKGVLSRAMRKKSGISLHWVIKIVEIFPQYSANWLLTGEGEKFRNKEKAPVSSEEKIKLLEQNISLMAENNSLLNELREKDNEINMLKNEKKELLESLKEKSDTKEFISKPKEMYGGTSVNPINK